MNIINNIIKTDTDINNEMLLSITWSELKDLRDNSELIPGQQYRITDYVATTIDPESRSANHPFDVVVVADDNNTLNENARAICHNGDEYFKNSDLNAWRLKYCIDNDLSRFTWAQNQAESYIANIQGAEFAGELLSTNDTTYAGYPYKFMGDTGEQFYGVVEFYSPVLNGDNITFKVFIPTYNTTMDFVGNLAYIARDNGKGVIYQMIDEYLNEAQYDFKGIQFKRYKINRIYNQDFKEDFYSSVLYNNSYIDYDTNSVLWCYLFSGIKDNKIVDFSVDIVNGAPRNNVFKTSFLMNGVILRNNERYVSPSGCSCGVGCYRWTAGTGSSGFTSSFEEVYNKLFNIGNSCSEWVSLYNSNFISGNECSNNIINGHSIVMGVSCRNAVISASYLTIENFNNLFIVTKNEENILSDSVQSHAKILQNTGYTRSDGTVTPIIIKISHINDNGSLRYIARKAYSSEIKIWNPVD